MTTRHSLAALLLVPVLLTGPTGRAFAHASLIGSDPADGAVLALAPTEIVLRFDEEVVPIQLRLIDASGAEVMPSAKTTTASTVLRARYATNLADGAYFASYRVTSADGHPVAGSIVFRIGPAEGTAGTSVARPSNVSSGWIIPAMAARWAFYLCAVLAAGGLIYQILVAEIPPRLRRPLCAVAACGALLSILQIGLRGALLTDATLGELLSLVPWTASFATPLGISLLLAGIGMGGCALVLAARRQLPRALTGLPIMLVLISFPLSGHAATASPRWLTAPSLLVHAAVALFWIGSFWPLAAQFNSGSPATVVRRFSRIAAPAVLLLAGVGAFLAYVQIKRPSALLDSVYGQLVSAKLLVFLSLLGLAAWNRLRLSPELAAGIPGAADRLRRIIHVEAILGVLVLAITAALTLSPPPRSLSVQDAAIHQHLHGGT